MELCGPLTELRIDDLPRERQEQFYGLRSAASYETCMSPDTLCRLRATRLVSDYDLPRTSDIHRRPHSDAWSGLGRHPNEALGFHVNQAGDRCSQEGSLEEALSECGAGEGGEHCRRLPPLLTTAGPLCTAPTPCRSIPMPDKASQRAPLPQSAPLPAGTPSRSIGNAATHLVGDDHLTWFRALASLA
jgi:hypothetical protein